MPFLIRHAKKQKLVSRRNDRRKIKKAAAVVQPVEIRKRKRDDDEVQSESSDDDRESITSLLEPEEKLTAQQKKVKLAAKYLEELKKQVADENGVEEHALLQRLKENELERDGKLIRSVADRLQFGNETTTLRCKQQTLTVTCMVISYDNQYLYTGAKDFSIVKWSLAEMRKENAIFLKSRKKSNLPKDDKMHKSTVNCLATYRNKFLCSGDDDGLIIVWNASTLQHTYTFKGHKKGVTGLVICPETCTLYSTSKDSLVKVWALNEFAYVETLFGHQANITSVDILDKNRIVTSGGTDNTLRVWKLQEESQLVYNGHTGSIDMVRRLDDGHFVSGGDDGALCLWGVLKKKPLQTISQAHGPNWISCVAVMPNSDVVASGSCNGQVRLWKCSGRMMQPLTSVEVKGFVNAIVFADRWMLVAVGKEHRLGRWDVQDVRNSIVCIPIIQDVYS